MYVAEDYAGAVGYERGDSGEADAGCAAGQYDDKGVEGGREDGGGGLEVRHLCGVRSYVYNQRLVEEWKPAASLTE